MRRNFSLDLLKVLLAIMVVGIHTEPLLDISAGANFFTANGIFRLAVPVFFVTSGYFFLSIDSPGQLKKWLMRVALLYAFWMLVYLPFYNPPLALWDAPSSLFRFLLTLVHGYFHLWYVAAILVAGPLLYLLRRHPPVFLLLAAAVIYAAGSAMQYLGYCLGVPLFKYQSLYRNFLFFALPLMMVGLAAAKINIAAINTKLLLSALVIGAAGLGAEILLAGRYPADSNGFDMYLSLFVVAPALFLLVIKSDLPYPKVDIAILSSVIYFLHVWVFLALDRYFGWRHGMQMFLCTLLASCAAYLLIVRLPPRFKVVF